MAKINLEQLELRFPGIKKIYLENIVDGLHEEDYDVLDGVKDKPGYVDARKRLDMANLSNYDKSYQFKTYHQEKSEGTPLINEDGTPKDWQAELCKYIDSLFGNFQGNEGKKFVLGGIAQHYLNVDGLNKNEEDNPKIKKENFNKRKERAKQLYSNKYKEYIEAVREGTSSIGDARFLIDELAGNLDRIDTASLRIKEAHKTIPFEGLFEGDVKAEVWKRDPSKDMSYFREFNCCAFLGADEGHLYAPKYLKNGAVSMIDFSMNIDGEEQRLVRAITAACVERKDKHLTGKTYMLVDSVEGSERIDRETILDALTNYAEHSGFDGVIFYHKPGNAVPRHFLNHLSDKAIKKRKINLQLLYSDGHEFFEGLEGEGVIGAAKGYAIDFLKKNNNAQHPS